MAMAKATILAAVVAALAVVQLAGAVDHPVGGDGSWDTSGSYDAWSAKQTFKQGDTLSFKYSGSHDVTEVTKAGYDSCSGAGANAVKSYAGTSATVKLAAAGKRYFICSVPGHCAAGMKLEVTVAAAAAATTAPAPAAKSSKPRHQRSVAPTPSPAPAPAPDAAATSSTDEMPAPSPKSSAAAAATVGGKAALAAVGLAVAVAALAM